LKYCVQGLAGDKLDRVKTILSIALVLTISGCSTAELIYIDYIRPHCQSNADDSSSVNNGEGSVDNDLVTLYDVDAYPDLCCSLDEETGLPESCVSYGLFNHRASITFVNEMPVPESSENPSLGRATINNMDIEYTSNQDGPNLPKISVPMLIQLAAEQSTLIVADLVNDQTKNYFRELNEALGENKVTSSQNYTAHYTFSGLNDLKIKGKVIFNIGDYIDCSEDFPIQFSAYGESLLSNE